MLYQAYQTHSDLFSPLRLLAQHQSALLWLQKTEGSMVRKLSAASEVMSRLRLTHSRPPYNIDSVEVKRRGKVRQGKLYYLRDLEGKKARIKEDLAAYAKQS